MTQRNLARKRALSPGSSARIAVAALITLSLVGAGTAADAVQPKTSQPARIAQATPVREAALTSSSTATVAFEVLAFTAVPAPKPEPAKPVVTVEHATTKATATHKGDAKAKPKVLRKRAVHHTTSTKSVRHVVKKTAKKRVVTHITKHRKHVVTKAKKNATKKVRHAKKATRSSAGGASIISIARSKVGSAYRYGATGPNVFDCSGFVGYVYRRAGHSLPRMAKDMYPAVRHVSSPRAGDIIFFINGGHATHVGIYAGHGMMYDSPRSGRTVGLHAYKYYNGAVRFGRA